jgi:hypothetical protein
MSTNTWYNIIKNEEKKIEDSPKFEDMVASINNTNRDTLIEANDRLIEVTTKRILCE